ncbi:argininosuccinate lyase 2 domain protein [Burkholderia pseudomallei]|nr:argininosuccinate lyase 2 domain protein [Burkholderia pseudomallei]
MPRGAIASAIAANFASRCRASSASTVAARARSQIPASTSISRCASSIAANASSSASRSARGAGLRTIASASGCSVRRSRPAPAPSPAAPASPIATVTQRSTSSSACASASGSVADAMTSARRSRKSPAGSMRWPSCLSGMKRVRTPAKRSSGSNDSALSSPLRAGSTKRIAAWPRRRGPRSGGVPACRSIIAPSTSTPVAHSIACGIMPPARRGLISITTTLPPLTRHSTWAGPKRWPTASSARSVSATIASRCAAAIGAGKSWPASTKCGSGPRCLPVTPSTAWPCSAPSPTTSTENSGPSTNDCTSTCRASAMPRSLPRASSMRSPCASISAGVRTSRTPTLPEPNAGFSTRGYVAPCARSRSCVRSDTISVSATPTPASRRRRCSRPLSRQVRIASGSAAGKPRRVATVAAVSM